VGISCLRVAMSEAPRDKVAEELLAPSRFSGITADSYTPDQVRSARRRRLLVTPPRAAGGAAAASADAGARADARRARP
jgi:hypothetical protein